MPSGLGNLSLSYEQIGNILKSDEVMNVCVQKAEELKKSDQRIVAFVGFDRCHAHIYQDREKK